MNFLDHLSIKNKLIGIVLLVTVLSNALGFSFVIINDIQFFRQELISNTLMNAKLTGEYCVAPLIFDDQKGAEEILAKLQTIPYIENGFLFDEKGNVFSSFNKNRKISVPELPEAENYSEFGNQYLHIFYSIMFKGEKYGTIYLRASTEMVTNNIRKYLATILLLILALLVLSYFLAHRLQRVISEPILKLASVTEKISKDADYSMQVKNKHSDEIGVLYEGFNEMLQQIHLREQDLSEEVMERKRTEIELKNTRNYLTNIFNSMPSVLISLDSKGVITKWNTAAEEYIGIQEEEALSQKIWEVVPFLANYQEDFQEVIATHSPKELHRESFIFSDKKKYLNIFIYPLEHDGINGAVIRVDDVTELENKDEQLRQAQKMETVGNLAGGLAHDFNNALGGIMATTTLIKYMLKDEEADLEEILGNIGIIEEATNHAADMVQQLLTLSRRHELSLAPVDLNRSVKNVIKICQNTFDKSIELNTYFYEGRAMVKADPAQIEQVLLNLCVNASHAMTIMRDEDVPQGGVLNVAIEKIYAGKHFCSNHPESVEGSYWVMKVQDTGVGMDTKAVSKIFDPFYSTKKKYNGTGLGLAMVYNIVQQHKGFIDVYSELGIGSTFNIFLPALQEDVGFEEKKEEEEEIPKGSGLILVVDDEEIMRQIAQLILAECGYDVVVAKDGLEGIEIFKKRYQEIEAVVLDMAMPKLSGKETYMEMRKIDPDFKVLLASGFRQDKRVQDTIQMGVHGFIQKPFTMIKLAKKVKEVIECKSESLVV